MRNPPQLHYAAALAGSQSLGRIGPLHRLGAADTAPRAPRIGLRPTRPVRVPRAAAPVQTSTRANRDFSSTPTPLRAAFAAVAVLATLVVVGAIDGLAHHYTAESLQASAKQGAIERR